MNHSRLLLTPASLLLAALSHAALVPLHGEGPEDVKTLRVRNRAVVPMVGAWKFAPTRGRIAQGRFVPAQPKGTNEGFVAPTFDDKGWATIAVPSNWEVAGFSRPTYNEPDDAVGLYRRFVDVPASFAGKRVLWHFDGVFDGAEVWVNGTKVGYHEGGYGAFDLDVTSAIHPGQTNGVALRVSKLVPSSPLDSGDYWALGGIYRENYLLEVPKTHVDDVTITTDLDRSYRDANLSAKTRLVGTPGETLRLAATLHRFDGGLVTALKESRTVVGSDGTALVDLAQIVKAPKLWSAEKPNLYYLVLTLKDAKGQEVERVQERFGFRKIEIKGGVVLWNGQPIKLAGTCRHEEWSAVGHALTEHEWQTDAAMMKAANINAVRTSHYNHAQRFLEICEEKGFYILDEAAGCWADMKDERLKAPMVQHAQETFARDKNRPCVLAWSIGNESGVGPVNLAAFDWIKRQDPTRPAFISWASKWADPRLDFDDRHYPSLDDLKGRASNDERKTTPLLLSEQPHAYYGDQPTAYDPGFHEAWWISLQNNWNVIWDAPGIVGSFIWEWQDQGLLDKFPGNEDRDLKTGLRSDNHKGLVDGFRNPKGELYDVKMVYSPVVVPTHEISAGRHARVPLVNRYRFTDLGELTCRWQALAGERVLASGKRSVPLAPMKTGEAVFDLPSGVQTLRLEFVHPDGRSVYATRLGVAGAASKPAPLPSSVGGSVRIEDGSTVRLTQGTSVMEIDKGTGLLRSWTVGGQTVATSGPVLNLGERRPPGGPLPAKDFVESKRNVFLRNVRVEAANGVVTVTGDACREESPERLGVFAYTLTPKADGQVDVRWSLDWTAIDANAWELGVRFMLPTAFAHLEWHRDAPWTEYPKDHPGRPDGAANASDVAFRSTKRDVRWMLLSGDSPTALELLRATGPLHARARAEDGAITLYANAAVAPPKNHNESTPELDIHLVKGHRYEGSLRVRAVSVQRARLAREANESVAR